MQEKLVYIINEVITEHFPSVNKVQEAREVAGSATYKRNNTV